VRASDDQQWSGGGPVKDHTCGCHPSKRSDFGPVSLDGTVQPKSTPSRREIDQKSEAKVRLHLDASVDAIGDAVLGSDTTHRRIVAGKKKKEKKKWRIVFVSRYMCTNQRYNHRALVETPRHGGVTFFFPFFFFLLTFCSSTKGGALHSRKRP
jgi:hypothetical protein